MNLARRRETREHQMKRLLALAFALLLPVLGWAQNSYISYAATFAYAVDGVAQSKTIQRMVYALPTSVCN
jgi:hypothetical protein